MAAPDLNRNGIRLNHRFVLAGFLRMIFSDLQVTSVSAAVIANKPKI
jgi:hypothetical protein